MILTFDRKKLIKSETYLLRLSMIPGRVWFLPLMYKTFLSVFRQRSIVTVFWLLPKYFIGRSHHLAYLLLCHPMTNYTLERFCQSFSAVVRPSTVFDYQGFIAADSLIVFFVNRYLSLDQLDDFCTIQGLFFGWTSCRHSMLIITGMSFMADIRQFDSILYLMQMLSVLARQFLSLQGDSSIMLLSFDLSVDIPGNLQLLFSINIDKHC